MFSNRVKLRLSMLPEFDILLRSYAAECDRIRRQFEETGDGRAAVSRRADLIDHTIQSLLRNVSEKLAAPDGLSLIALGGYGRGSLFPHSDVDILFLCANNQAERNHHQTIVKICQALWDLHLRVSPTTRTLADCDEFRYENAEFTISLLDCRCVAGDAELFAQLHDFVIPRMAARERRDLLRALHELTRARHARHGNTIFHLEPNIKDAPGGLRDYGAARWLLLIASFEDHRPSGRPEDSRPSGLREECLEGFDCLTAVRCFLHYRRGRDDNLMTYELQNDAASLGIGKCPRVPVSAALWMRRYFLFARAIHRLLTDLLDAIPPARSFLFERFEEWQSKFSNEDFSVSHGRVFLRRPDAFSDVSLPLRLFEFTAKHGLKLSGDTEERLEKFVVASSRGPFVPPDMGTQFRKILLHPHSAAALRAMHRAGLLVLLFPEFGAIDGLVIRDFYHRYTVDEHSLKTVESIHQLAKPENEWERKYNEIFSELEQPELLFFALLFHDVGKGLLASNHVKGSLEAAEGALARMEFASNDRNAIRFLIANHLEMSTALQRRDIFDPAVIQEFAQKTGTPERLKMLCLLTYADIRSVNPEAFSPWKAEMLWQLYAATINHLNLAVDQERLRAGDSLQEIVKNVLQVLNVRPPAAAVSQFLNGLPRRFLASRTVEQIAAHVRLASQLKRQPIQAEVTKHRGHFLLTLVAHDRPLLFANIAGILYAWGMSVTKAEAFGGSAGIVVDTFQFVDLFRTLELNPPEVARLEENLRQALVGKAALDANLSNRRAQASPGAAKVSIPLQLHFNDTCSAYSTVLEIITQDRPGLLYVVSSALAEAGCNIEVALIDTEGPKAIDVFYLTVAEKKLSAEIQRNLMQILATKLT